MTSDTDARAWLRANDYGDVADQIDKITERWRVKGVRTRRNWWEILAGSVGGDARSVDGVVFPVLAAFRRRNGMPAVKEAIERTPGEVAPFAMKQRRWAPTSTQVRTPRRDPERSAGRAEKTQKGAGRRTDTDIKKSTMAESKKTKSRKTRPRKREPESRGPGAELSVQRFAHLENILVPLRDLVVLVGPQATGVDSPLRRYRILLTLARATETEGLMLEDRSALVTEARRLALAAIAVSGEDKYSYSTFVKVGRARYDLVGKLDYLDEAIQMLRKGSEVTLDPELQQTLDDAERKRLPLKERQES